MRTQDYSFESLSKTIYNGLYIETAFVDFVAGLQDLLLDYVEKHHTVRARA
jgi:hypothetical protein